MAGRAQIRVYGQHDDQSNIKDKDLYWALPIQPITSAAHSKKGTAPVGLVVGSVVVGYWQDADHTIPMMTGTIAKAGDPKEGASKDGSKEIDKDKNSTPTTARNKDVNPVLKKPNPETDDGKNVVEEGIKNAKAPSQKSIGTVTNGEQQGSKVQKKDDVLDKVKKVDPKNESASVEKAVDQLRKMKEIGDLTSAGGLLQMASSAAAQALTIISSHAPLGNVLDGLSEALSTGMSDVAAQALSDAASALVSALNSGALAMAELLSQDLSSLVGQVVDAAARELVDALLIKFQTGTITADGLVAAIEALIESLKKKGSQAGLGLPLDGAGAAQNAIQLMGAVGSLVQSALKDHLPKSVLDQSKVTKTLDKYTKAQARVKKREDHAKEAFSSADVAKEKAKSAVEAGKVTLGSNTG